MRLKLIFLLVSIDFVSLTSDLLLNLFCMIDSGAYLEVNKQKVKN